MDSYIDSADFTLVLVSGEWRPLDCAVAQTVSVELALNWVITMPGWLARYDRN